MVLAPIVRGRKGEYGKQLEELRAEGFARVKIDGELRRLDEEIVLDKKYKHDIAVVVDRLVMKGELRKRLADSIETAVALADGLVEIELVATSDDDPDLLGEVRLSGARPEPGRARAADLLLQLAARRVPALHRARARRWRSTPSWSSPTRRCRSARARSRRGRRARRTTTSSSRRRSPSATRSTSRRRGRSCPAECQRLLPVRHQRRARCRSPTATASAAGARTRRRSRGSSRTSSGATARPTPTGRARRSRST